MTAARIRSRLVRLECMTQVAASVPWLVPATGEEAVREAAKLVETWQARSAALDAALTSTDTKRRAWAKRTIAELKEQNSTPEAKAMTAEIMATLERLRQRGIVF